MRALRAAAFLALLAAGIGSVAGAQPPRGERVDFTRDEREAIVRHGPWPVSWPGDPSNRVSRQPAAIDFGNRLFFDPRLSSTGSVSCATCHVPEKDWADGRKLGVGLAEVDRNTPTVLNVRYHRWFGWDGGNDNLWAQSMRPFLDTRELATSEAQVAKAVREDADLSCRYRAVFGRAVPSDDELVLVDVAKALAAFQSVLTTGRTPFDDFRDALARGDAKAVERYPAAAQRGAKLFVGKGNCNLCHVGPQFTHGEFHEIGIPILRKSGGVDWGRYQGIKMLVASRFNLLGGYSDDRQRTTATSTKHVAPYPQTFEQFKVPSLRNVARSAPYMHNGHLATLRDVVMHYSTIDPTFLHAAHVYVSEFFGDDISAAPPTDNLLKPLKLTDREIDDLVAFLETLSDDGVNSRRRPALDPRPCGAGDAVAIKSENRRTRNSRR